MGSGRLKEYMCIKLPCNTFYYPSDGSRSFTNDTKNNLNDFGCLFFLNINHREISQNGLRTRLQTTPSYQRKDSPYDKIWENKKLLNEPI